MRNLLIYIFISISLLGCNAHVAECGDQDMIDLVKQTSVDIYKDYMMKQFGVRDARLGYGVPMAGAVLKNDANKNNLEVEVSQINFITTTKHDKELPRRECTAEINFNILKKIKDQNQVWENLSLLATGRSYAGSIKYPEAAKVDYIISPNAQDKSRMIVNVTLKFK